MDKKTVGIIATIVAVFLCGCPGVCLFLFGAIAATGQIPYTTNFPYTSDFGNPYSETVPSYLGFVGLCLALIFIAIPIVVGVLTLRNKPEKAASFNEPLPPAS
jgi:nitric oxide reductase large subunit